MSSVALGGDRRNVRGFVLRGGLAELGLRLAMGTPAAVAGGRLLAHQLYGVKSYDPAILGAAALVLSAGAVFAASGSGATGDTHRSYRGLA